MYDLPESGLYAFYATMSVSFLFHTLRTVENMLKNYEINERLKCCFRLQFNCTFKLMTMTIRHTAQCATDP